MRRTHHTSVRIPGAHGAPYKTQFRVKPEGGRARAMACSMVSTLRVQPQERKRGRDHQKSALFSFYRSLAQEVCHF